MQETVDIRSENFYVFRVCVVRMPRVEEAIGSWIAEKGKKSCVKLNSSNGIFFRGNYNFRENRIFREFMIKIRFRFLNLEF